MKNTIACLLITITSLWFSGCTKAQQAVSGKNTLIVYLSRTNNTKAVAAMIHHWVGGTLMAIELKKPYPADYQETVKQVARENETGYLPELKTKIDSIDKFDTVFIGFPTWGMQLPPPMKSFLKQYKLNGKVVIPFNTNAGYGVGSSFETVKQLCPGSEILDGFSVVGGKEKEGILFVMEGKKEIEARTMIEKWLKKIKVLK